MTHRILIRGDGKTTRIEFQGILDAHALEAILSSARDARRRGAGEVVLVLQAGTEVDRTCVEILREAEGYIVEAESPFLARWLGQAGSRRE